MAEKLKTEHGIYATLINPRYISQVDEEVLRALPEQGHRLVVTLEDGVVDGGFGEQIAGLLWKIVNSGVKLGQKRIQSIM